MNATKVRSKCGEEKSVEEFPWKSRILGKRHKVCKQCMSVRSSKWYYAHRERQIKNVHNNNRNYREVARKYIWEYLSAHPCVDCGESDPVVLEFDHVHGQKLTAISTMISRGFSLEQIKEEIEKCEVRCSNCHRRKTAKDRGWFRWRQ